MPLKTVYSSGAAFQTENNKGKLYVTDQGVVENLNADMIDGAHIANLVKQGTVDNVDYGLVQNGKTITATGINASAASSAMSLSGSRLSLDSNSVLKIGGIEIVAASNGVLFGVATN